MLVPELLDIAEQLKITGSKKLDKQELIYKILDKQAVVASEVKSDPNDDKPKRKRIIKTSTANSNEEAIVESGELQPKRPEVKKEVRKKEEKPLLKKGVRKKKDDEESVPSHNRPEPEMTQRRDEPESDDDQGS